MCVVQQTSEKLGVSQQTVFYLAAEEVRPTTDTHGAYESWRNAGTIVGWVKEFCDKTLGTFNVTDRNQRSLFKNDDDGY